MSLVQRKAIGYCKAVLTEWIAGGEYEHAPLKFYCIDEHTNIDQCNAILNKNNVSISNTSSESDWVEITYSVDDRVSVIHPGDYIIVWDNDTISVLHNVAGITVSNDGAIIVDF